MLTSLRSQSLFSDNVTKITITFRW